MDEVSPLAEAERFESKVRRRQTIRLATIAVLVAAAAALAADNRDDVRIGWVVDDGTAPLLVVLVVAFVLGLAIGWLTRRPRRDGR